MDLPDSPRPGQRFHQHQQQLQQEQHQQPHDTSKDKKRTKDKDRPHSHFGQRLSKAIGLSSSSSKNHHQQQQQRQQQRLRQLSVDSLSTIDAAPPPTIAKASEAPQQQSQQAQRQTGKPTLEKEKEKEKRGGIMNHFLHRPRILSPSDGLKSKVLPHMTAGSATGAGMPSITGNRINSFKTPDASFAQSATNSDISLDSEAAHRRDSVGNGADGSGSATGEDSDTGALRKFQSRHRQDRGSSNSGKSLVDTLTVHNFRRRPSLIVDLMPLSSSYQHHHQQLYQKVQPLPPSMADMVESTLEVHHPHHHPGDMERLDLYSHLGLQEMHYNTGTGEEPSEKMIRQLYGNAVALRKDHSSTSFLSSPSGFGAIDPRDHPRRASTPGVNLSEAHSSITSNASIFAATMASPGPLTKSTSTRFGKLGRFNVASSSSHQQQQHQQLQIQRPLLNNQDVVVPIDQQRHNGHPRQQSRSLGKSFIGPENLNANMPRSSSSGTSNGSSSGQQHHGIGLSFRSGLLRRSSRRTVSASHISSKNIFDLDTASSSHQEAAAQAYQDLMGPQAQGGEDGGYGEAEGSSPISQFSERNMLSAALIEGLAAVDAIETHTGKPEGEAAGDSGAEGLPSGKSTGSIVGQYLFGDDFKNLAFGERDSASLVKVDSTVDTTTAAVQPAILAKLTEPTGSPSLTTKVKVDQDKALLSKLLGAKKKSDSFLPSANDSTLSTLSTRNSSSSLASATATAIAPASSPTHLYMTDSKAAAGPMIVPRDRKLTLGSKATSHSKQQQQETPTTPTPPAFIPRSPAAVAASRKYPGDPGLNSPSPPSYSSSHSPISATPIPTPGVTPTKSKFSILGPSATSGTGFSYLQNRPSLSLTMTSSSSTLSSSHHGLGSSSSSTSPYIPHHSSSVPLPGKSSHGSIGGSTIPHLEPRSAVVDYRPAIHYKRQRSMSLQDADLLTADQFIALMPDDAPTKRRFSSEETVSILNIVFMQSTTGQQRVGDERESKKRASSRPTNDIEVPPQHPQNQMRPSPKAPRGRLRANITTYLYDITYNATTAAVSSSDLLRLIRSESLSSHLTTDLIARKLAEENETSLAVSPSEQDLIRIQGTKDLQLQQQQQTVLAFKDVVAGGRVSVDDVRSMSYDGERGSAPSATSTTMPGGSRTKKSSLLVGGCSGVNPSNGCAAPSETSASSGQLSEPKQDNENPPIDVDQIDVVEMVGILFDEMDQIMTRMVEMLAKYISTDQFSKLLKESDEICYQAQEVCRVELDRRCQKRQDLRRSQHQHQQQEQLQRKPQHAPHQDEEVEVEVVFERGVLMDQQAITVMHQPPPLTQPQKLEFSKEPIWAISTEPCDRDPPRDPPHPLSSAQHNHSPQQQASAPFSVPTPTKPVAIPIPSSLAGSAETAGDEDDRHVKKKDSKDRIRHRRDRNHYKHQYRYHPQGGQGKKHGEAADPNGEIMSSEEHQGAVYDYIRAVLTIAEGSMAEYMRIYNRMLVVPTNGYRTEGCNDLKKIERNMRPDHPHIAPLSITKTSTSGSSQPSLLSRISAVQNATTDLTSLSPGSKTSTATPAVGYGVPNPPGHNPSAHASVTTSVNSTAMGDTSDQALSPTMNDIFSPPNAASSSGGHAMVRVKSLPESKDEWAALQKRKEMGGSPGVAGAISMGTPAAVGITVSGGNATVGIGGGIGGIGATGAAAAGMVTDTRIAMMGEYSTEHMGHEAYYYRNWFLGKEHRTFVGQVEGLGTVIISIIKDMVIPTEGRLQLPLRSSTGPNSFTHLSSFVSPASAGAGGGGSGSHPAGLTRPELVHSAQSFYPGRGTGFHGSGVCGNGMLASPRTSSEAMRTILSASTAIASGAGSSSDTHGSGLSGVTSSSSGAGPTMGSSHLAPSTPATPGPYSPNASQPNYYSGSNNSSNNANTPPRWQYRCILRQKDVDSIRITLPEPEPSPLNNLTRRAGKPQWKTILQSIHPAITQQVASKLKKVQNNPHFEKELAKFDETMLRFNYKFGVLLVHPGQTKEEDWFSNQMSSSPRFQEFLESGALGQKVALKGFERFSAGLDTRSEGGEYSYYDTWGEGFEIMYHVSTLLPYNTVDRQQIQRKRHIGNDIVCIIFVDGDQPFVPNAIKSQFLHIFVIIHLIVLPDGNKAYSATVTCDEQVPEFGPPLPDPPIFKTPEELRAFLLCKMINGENAAYKAPRLIKPHQRARSGMLENLVAKANTLAKVKDIDKKLSKQQKTTATATATTTAAVVTPTTSSTLSVGPSAPHTLLSMSSSPNLTPSYPNVGGGVYSQSQSPYCNAQHCQHQQNLYQHGCQYCVYDKDVHSCCSAASTAAPHASISSASLGEDYTHSHHQSAHLINGRKGPIPAAIRTNNSSGSVRNSLVVLGTETAASLFKSRRRSSNADGTKVDAQLHTGIAASKEKDVSGGGAGDREQQQQQQGQTPDQFPEGHGYIESLMSPTVPGMIPLPSPMLGPASLSVADIGPFFQQRDVNQCSGGRGSCCQNQNNNCCCFTPTCCSYSCCEDSDCAVEIPQSRPTQQTPNGTVKYGAAHHPQYLQGVLKHPSKSAASSPTEAQFAMNRLAGYAQGEHHSHYHTVTLMNGLDAAMLSAERKGFGTLGMSLTGNSKGRSKSEVDLLLTPNQEVHNSLPNRHSISGSAGLNEFHHHHHSHAGIIATTPHAHQYLRYHRGGSTGQQHQYSPITPNGTIPIRTSSLATTGPVTHQTATAPAHSSMKGRAHNFLTTLVRRRASSNDTSGLGPTAHQIGVPKHSNLGAMASSPLGTWINTAGSNHNHQKAAYTDQHQHHRQQNSHHTLCCCQALRHQHQLHHHPPQQRHSFNSLSPNPAASTPLTAAPQEGSTKDSVPILGRPLKFKEGYSNKGKAAPMHINTAAAAAMGSSSATATAASYQSQYHHQHSSHYGHLNHHNHNPPSASTLSSASSSLYHSSIPSASTVKTAGSSYRAGSLGGSGTSMMLATPSSSSSSGFSPHSLRSVASKEAIHRSTSSPSQNQGLGRSTGGRSEGLTPILASADAGSGAVATSEGSSSINQGEAVIKASSSSEAVQVTDATDGKEDGTIHFTESPLPYTPQGQLTAAQMLPTSSGSKPMESRTSIDSLGDRPHESSSATVPTAFPPGIGNLNRSPMDYMSFKPATSSSSSSARNSLLQQQRYDPGYSAAARVRGQSGDVVRRRGQHLLDPDLDDDDDDDIGSGGKRYCARNSSEDLARFLSMGPLALRESHAVMTLEHSSDQHQHQYQHQVYEHQQNPHHHHHGHHDHSYGHAGHHNHHHHHYHHYHHAPSPPARQQYQYPREVRRPSSGSLPLRNESHSRFYHTATPAPPVADASKTTGHVNLPPVTPAITRTMSSGSTSSGKQVKRAVSVESFLGQETVLSRVPSLRSKGYGLEAALLSTMMMTIRAPGSLASANGYVEASCSLPSVHRCCSGPASGAAIVGPACEVMLGDQDELEIQNKSSSASLSPSTTAAVAADGISNATVQTKSPLPVTPAITKSRQESNFVQESNDGQHSCSIESEELDMKPIDT
ncbi:Rap/ran-GAP protein [Mortierella sp. AD032]|nr:Rap/ran-GAP protein [Mortierella sp. AD032]